MKKREVINRDYAELGAFVRDIHENFDTGRTLHDGRNTVRLFDVAGEKIVVKRFRRPNPFNRVVYTFLRGSKARRGYANALRLLSLGVGTPAPIGYIDVLRGGLVETSYLVTGYTDYASSFKLLEKPGEKNRELLRAFAEFTARLHRTGVCHDDYNLGNVLYKRVGDGFDFVLIDVNRMRFGRMSKRACVSNIKRTCADPDFTYFFAKEYSAIRGWSLYRSVAGFAMYRSHFETLRRKRKKLKKFFNRITGKAGK